jgi:hypothetical protein
LNDILIIPLILELLPPCLPLPPFQGLTDHIASQYLNAVCTMLCQIPLLRESICLWDQNPFSPAFALKELFLSMEFEWNVTFHFDPHNVRKFVNDIIESYEESVQSLFRFRGSEDGYIGADSAVCQASGIWGFSIGDFFGPSW